MHEGQPLPHFENMIFKLAKNALQLRKICFLLYTISNTCNIHVFMWYSTYIGPDQGLLPYTPNMISPYLSPTPQCVNEDGVEIEAYQQGANLKLPN